MSTRIVFGTLALPDAPLGFELLDRFREAGGRARVVDYSMHPLLVRREGHVIEPLEPSEADAGGETAAAWQLAQKMLGSAMPGAPSSGRSD